MDREQITLDNLIQVVQEKIIDLNYCEGHVRHYKECWNVLKKYAHAQGTQILTHELAVNFLAKRYGIALYERNIQSSYKALMRRAVMLLLEYQLTGNIIKRVAESSHEIQPFACEAVEMYMDYLCNTYDLAKGTLRNHYRTLEHFFDYLYINDVNSISDITPDNIKDYLLKLGCCSKSYISSQINNLRRFFDFAVTNNLYNIDLTYLWPIVRVEKYRNVPKTFTPEEILKILSAVDRGNPLGKRDYAILILAIRYGLRVSDIKNLELCNFDFVNSKLRIIQIKTENPLELDLLFDVTDAILDYIKNGRPNSKSQKIFVLHKAPYNEFSDSSCLGQIVCKYTSIAGISKPNRKGSMHMFRYSLASAMLSNETPLPVISDILGHSNLNSTRIYTKIDIEQLKKCALEVPYEA